MQEIGLDRDMSASAARRSWTASQTLSRRLMLEQSSVACAPHDAALIERLYALHGQGYVRPRGDGALAASLEAGRYFLLKDDTTGELLAAAGIFEVGGELLEFGGHCSALARFGVQRMLTRVSLAATLSRGDPVSRVIAVVHRENKGSSYNLIRAGFRRRVAPEAFLAASDLRRLALATTHDCFGITHAEALRQVALLREALATGRLMSVRSGAEVALAWGAAFLDSDIQPSGRGEAR